MTADVNLTTSLIRWSHMIEGIAKTGLTFANHPYDVERYEELLTLAAEMTATINGEARFDPALAAEVESTWRAHLQSDVAGYPTPKVGVGAVVFNAADQLLLVHSTFRNDWFFPGGLADLGYAPSEVACKEALEEAGLDVTPIQFMGVLDSLRNQLELATHTYSLLFYCQLNGGEPSPQTREISAARFFDRNNLPSPLTMDVTFAFDWHFERGREAFFD